MITYDSSVYKQWMEHPDIIVIRVRTSSGNHGKSHKKFPCIEKSWNLNKPE